MSVVSVDLGRTKARACLVSDEMEMLDMLEWPTAEIADTGTFLRTAAEIACMLAGRHADAAAVGISIAGDVDRRGNVWYRRAEAGDRSHVGSGKLVSLPLAQIVSAQTGLPCAVENDGNAAGIAEWQAGAASGHDDIVCYTIGTHIGTGVVCAGEIVRRRTSGPSLGSAVSADLHGAGATVIIGDRCSGSGIGRAYGCSDARPVIDAARCGEERALAVLAEAGFWLGLLLANANNIFSPTVIVLGGGVIAAGSDLLLPIAMETFSRETTLSTLQDCRPKIVCARYGGDAGVIGAAIAALRL